MVVSSKSEVNRFSRRRKINKTFVSKGTKSIFQVTYRIEFSDLDFCWGLFLVTITEYYKQIMFIIQLYVHR